VVTTVLNSRLVEIDHANWAGPGAGRGGVSRGIPVMDVSERNDWSEVRVGLGHTGDYGSVYPTYGFIYDRPTTAASPWPNTAATTKWPRRRSPPPRGASTPPTAASGNPQAGVLRNL